MKYRRKSTMVDATKITGDIIYGGPSDAIIPKWMTDNLMWQERKPPHGNLEIDLFLPDGEKYVQVHAGDYVVRDENDNIDKYEAERFLQRFEAAEEALEPDLEIWEKLAHTLDFMRHSKPGDRSEKDRRWQIAITDMEKIMASWYYYVVLRSHD